MLAIIKTEFYKIKRYHILLIGILGMLCSPLLQLYSQAAMNEEYRRSYFGFADLLEVTIWGNAQIFMPVLFTLIGGYLINREYSDDTLKNILTVPVSYKKFMAGKLAAIGLLAILFGVYGFVVTVAVGFCAGIPDPDILVLTGGFVRMVGLSIGIYIVVLPIIAVCSRKPGMFMGGSIIAFVTGYMILFFKEGLLRNIYPYSAALTMIGFDMASYIGTSERGSVLLAVISLGSMLLVTVLLVCISGAPGEIHSVKKAKGKGISMRSAQRERMRGI